ncbi:hypothetical protein ACHAW5_003624 [Stephanodiscus triporus]|uniref:PCIF1 WW domain-containing protein n=1 Tax=Stephanodiscus triporus TaxID=2934178 RepID=A0ABD3P9M9_9STRA
MRAKKKRQASAGVRSLARDDALSMCNVAGLDDAAGGGGGGGGPTRPEDDCLEALASAQLVGATIASLGDDDDDDDDDARAKTKTTTDSSRPSSSSSLPPGTGLVPNVRIELARHLRTRDLSAFLLGSCPGLRMPTFERWLLDSRLEETRRLRSVVEGWIDDPNSRRTIDDGRTATTTKKKYGRAARYRFKEAGEEADARLGREKVRNEVDRELVRDAAVGRTIPPSTPSSRDGLVESWMRGVDRDPVLPHRVMETDPSCDGLSRELIAAMTTSVGGGGDDDDDDDSGGGERRKKAAAEMIVRELCRRTSEACGEIRNLQKRLGRYQRFSWDDGLGSDGGGGARGKKRKSGGGGGVGRNSADKILVEWHDDDRVCSLVYVPRKRKTPRPSSRTGGFREYDRADAVRPPPKNEPKPFVIKINAAHYRKLRDMFDSCHGSADASTATPRMPGERATHVFHAVLFSLVVRYSSLSGGQQINDWRGGGMQGAVHDGVFDCLSRWFGGSACGTECFASPFNSYLPRFFSAFPSPDLDGHFGSRGDFFDSPLYEPEFLGPRWFEINPPFSPGVMTEMAIRILGLMERQERKDSDVTCIVIIPTVRGETDDRLGNQSKMKEKKEKKKQKSSVDGEEGDESNNKNLMSVVNLAAKQSFYQLINSPYCKSHIILPAREHGFTEGGQHLRPTKFKESQCSTSVIILRSKSWMGADDAKIFENELREAFASRHAMEVEQRKCASKGS